MESSLGQTGGCILQSNYEFSLAVRCWHTLYIPLCQIKETLKSKLPWTKQIRNSFNDHHVHRYLHCGICKLIIGKWLTFNQDTLPPRKRSGSSSAYWREVQKRAILRLSEMCLWLLNDISLGRLLIGKCMMGQPFGCWKDLSQVPSMACTLPLMESILWQVWEICSSFILQECRSIVQNVNT